MRFLNKFKNMLSKKENKNKVFINPDKVSKDSPDTTRVFRPIRTDESQLHPQDFPCKAMLTYINHTNEQVDYPLGSARVNIGRIYENEICIRDVKASRLHAFIVLEMDSHIIYDAQSTNGTYVNSIKITRHKLQTGDKIKIGNVLFNYCQEG